MSSHKKAATIADDLRLLLDGSADIGHADSRSDAIQRALAHLFEDEALRLSAALALYQEGNVELEQAIALADVSRDRFVEIADGATPEGSTDGVLSAIEEEFSPHEPDE